MVTSNPMPDVSSVPLPSAGPDGVVVDFFLRTNLEKISISLLQRALPISII